jgi:hypothetical protein
MSTHSRKRKHIPSPKPSSLSPQNLISITETNTALSEEEKKKNLEKYIKDSFEFLRDTSKIKTGRDRTERETNIVDTIKQTNEKILLKYPELNNNVKFMAMIRGINTRTFGGKFKKTYKNNKKYRKRRTTKRNSI